MSRKRPTYEELAARIRELEEKILARERAYAAQREQAETLEALLNAPTEVVMLFDPDATILAINDLGAKRLGGSAEELIGKNLRDLLPPDVAACRIARGREVVRTGRPLRFRDEREGRSYDNHAYPVFDRSGQVRAVALYAKDITDLTEAHEARAWSEENFRSLAENANDGILVVSDEGVHVYANRRASEITGYPVEALVGTRIADLVHPEEVESVLAIYRRRIRGEDAPRTYETRLLRGREGNVVPVEVTAARTTWKGRPSILVIMRDITDRVRMEQELRESEERLRAIFEGSLDAIFLVDPETGQILEANPATSELLGRDLEEIVGEDYPQLYPQDLRDRARELFSGFVEGRWEGFPVEAELVRSDGARVPVEILAQVIQVHGVPVVHQIVRDITERKSMEEDLLKMEKLESLGVLAGGIAHDFNNILTAISMNLSMARLGGTLDEEISRMLSDAERAAARAKNLTRQLLAFAKGGVPVRKTVSLAKLLKEHAEFALSGSNVRPEYAIPDDLWCVDADEGQIGQVIHNLVLNAVQAMPEGGVVRIRAENCNVGGEGILPGLRPGRYVKISVEDHGIGIPERHLRKVFDPFFSTKQRGSGLGLTSSFTIVKQHEGHIRVDSKVGVGTTLTIYLPASKGMRRRKEMEGREVLQGRGRLLLIDDEAIIRRSAGEALGRLGYEVTVAPDGEEGARLFQEAKEEGRPFDATILDLTIPGGLGGPEAARKILAVDPKARIIASSGYSSDPVMANYPNYGFCEAILKPYRVQDLAEVVSKVLAGRRA